MEHMWPGDEVLPEVVDEEARPDQVVEVIHNRTGEEEQLLPLRHVDHLPFDVQRLVHVLDEQGEENLADRHRKCLHLPRRSRQ